VVSRRVKDESRTVDWLTSQLREIGFLNMTGNYLYYFIQFLI